MIILIFFTSHIFINVNATFETDLKYLFIVKYTVYFFDIHFHFGITNMDI